MKRYFKWFFVPGIAILLMLSSIDAMAGGSNRRGTNAADELLIPVGARYIAMAGASTAMVTGLDAIYWNPGGLDRSPNSASAMFSYMNYIADINVNYVAISVKFAGIGTLGLSFKSLGIGNIDITTTDAPDGTGGEFSPQFTNVGLTYSRALTDRVSVGGTAKLIYETMDRVSASGVAFDLGVQYSGLGNINGLDVGVVVRNLGSGMSFGGNGLLVRANPEDTPRPTSPYKIVAGKDELPSTMEIGLSYSYSMGETGSLNLSSVFQNNNYSDDLGRVGAEYSFRDMFFLRGGYSLSLDGTKDVTDESIHIYGATFGAGINYNLGSIDLVLDYAYRSVNFFDANNSFTVTLNF